MLEISLLITLQHNQTDSASQDKLWQISERCRQLVYFCY